MNEFTDDRQTLREIAERMFADDMSYLDIYSVFRRAVETASDNHSAAEMRALDWENGTVAK